MSNLKNLHEEGFSVLEAMVSVAILSIAFLSLLQLQSQFVQSIASFERADTRIKIRQEVAQYAQSVNFSKHGTGHIPFEGVNINWQATPIGEFKKVQKSRRFYVSMYNVSITITDPNSNGTQDSFSVIGLGWTADASFKSTIF